LMIWLRCGRLIYQVSHLVQCWTLGLMTSVRTQKQKQESLDFDILQEGYFNSGVLLMDLGQWREAGYGEALLKLIAANSYRHHDQDALNKLFLHNWQVLPLRWNMIPPVSYLFAKILKSKKYRVMAIEANKNPAIIHFAGRTKPWEFPLTKGIMIYIMNISFNAFC